MIKLCQKCNEERNSNIINPLYPICNYGYCDNLIDECTECPYKDCKNHQTTGDYSFINIDITDEDFNTIIRTCNEKDFIDAMIKLKKENPIEFGIKISQLYPSANEKQKHIDMEWNQRVAKTSSMLNKPHCPHCNSTNIKSLSMLNRGASVAMWGLFSKKINKSFECRNCGYTW